MGKPLEEVVLDRRNAIKRGASILLPSHSPVRFDGRRVNRRGFMKAAAGLAVLAGCKGDPSNYFPFLEPDPDFWAPIVNNATNPGIRVALGVREGLWRVGEGWDIEMNYRQFVGTAGNTASAKTNAQGVAYFEIPLNSNVSQQARFQFSISRNADGSSPYPECAFGDSENGVTYDSVRLNSPEYVVDKGFDMVSGIKPSDQQCFECQIFSDKIKWASCIEPRVAEIMFSDCSEQTGGFVLNANQSAFISGKELEMTPIVDYPNILRLAGYSSLYGLNSVVIQFPGLEEYKDRKLKKAELIMTLYQDTSMQSTRSINPWIYKLSGQWDEKEASANLVVHPVHSAGFIGSRNENRPNQKLVWDITRPSLWNPGWSSWWSIIDPPYGFLLREGPEDLSSKEFRTFYSSRTSNPPQLRLEFED